MELFSLGADRGAYTEDDVREMARALTGWTAEWTESTGLSELPLRSHAPRRRQQDRVRADRQLELRRRRAPVREHPLHASFFVTKLWGYFVPTPPSEATLASLQGLYVARAMHPRGRRGDPPAPRLPHRARARHAARRLQRRPAARDRPSDRYDRLGLASRRRRAAAVLPAERLRLGLHALARHLDGQGALGNGQLCDGEDLPEPVARQRRTAVQRKRGTGRGARERACLLGQPGALGESAQSIAASPSPACRVCVTAKWQQSPYRAMRQNALRMLIATSPDMQVS